MQLAAQAGERLADLLAGESGDDVVRCLIVESVEPAPDASRLLVTVTPIPGLGPIDPVDALARLERLSGRLRAGVASAITRKRAPTLLFRLAQPGGGG